MDLGFFIRKPLLGIAVIVTVSVILSVIPRFLLGPPITPVSILTPVFVSSAIGAVALYMTRRYVRQRESLVELTALFDLSSGSLGVAIDQVRSPGEGDERISEQTCRFFGVEAGAGATFTDLLDRIVTEDRAQFMQGNVEFFDAAVQEGETLETEVEFRRRVSEAEVRWTSALRLLSRKNGQRVRFVIYKDIQARKEDESKLRAIADNRAENLVTVSHEIRTPLNAILGLTDLLLQTRLNKTQRDHADKIHTAADTLEALIQNMLDLRRLDSGQLAVEAEPFDTDAFLQKLAALHMDSAEQKGLRYLVDISPNLPRCISSDQRMLLQIISNLLRNAVKFTEKGMVMLSASQRNAAAQSGLRRTELIIEVSDTGLGIEPSEQESIFDPYNRGVARNSLEGAGLGLALVRRFTDALGGKLELVSESGVGSKFSVSVPVEVVDADPLVETDLLAQLKSLRVIVVERRRLIGSHLRSVLSPHVKSVEVVDDVEAAALMLAKAEFDLVLLGYVQSESQAEQFKADLLRNTLLTPKVTAVSKISNIRSELFSVLDAVFVEPFTLRQFAQFVVQGREAGTDAKTPSLRTPLRSGALLKHLRILVAEDNEINQRVISEQLRSQGVQLQLVNNGREAIEALLRDRYDLILMDIEMPVMDGLTAAERIKSQSGWRNLPIIAVSAGITASQKARAQEAGMSGFVGKPYKFDELYDAIERALSAAQSYELQDDLFEPASAPVTEEQTYEELDLELAQEFWPTSESLVENLRLFVEKYPVADQLFTSQDPQTNAKLAHTLKGAAGFLGMTVYSTNLSEFNKALLEGSATDEMLSDICQQHRRVIDEVGQFLSFYE